jgi:hypothetical protein
MKVPSGELPQCRQVVGCVDVEGQRGDGDNLVGDAPGLGQPDVPLAAPGPEGRGDRVRGSDHERVGPGAMTVRDDDQRALRGGASQQLIELRRVERGAVAGDHDHSLGASTKSLVDTELSGLVVSPLVVGDDSRAPPTGQGSGSLARRDDNDLVNRGRSESEEHVVEHDLGEPGPKGRLPVAAEALFGVGKALHRKDGQRPHAGETLAAPVLAQTEGKAHRLLGQPGAGGGGIHEDAGFQHGNAVGRLVGDQAVDKPAVRRGDAVA